ncbi:glycine-rich cell wall structural protein-like isoform X2 [Agrilus planipennis]|uniref:Glycine-rich cell wall structural protein-like isoform X2 n=1 Tax=Agrilus planipennis TaxID=224129 RepID=A0A1W4WRX0_AGRPL|nr:glycine-rich cell wall structural protein-like isoform X2 [Agrilus planipennis]XP_025835122.1 glycine-rich cell wall structural protein-like isoform X2 [Agrilus planipennis]
MIDFRSMQQHFPSLIVRQNWLDFCDTHKYLNNIFKFISLSPLAHIGSGGLALIASSGGGFGGSHDSYGASLSSGGGDGHSFGGGYGGGQTISFGSLEGLGGHSSGGLGGYSGGGGGHGGSGGDGGFSGGDHHEGVSIVGLGEGKGSSFDLTGTIISSGKHEGAAHAQQAIGSGDLGDEHQLLSGAGHGLSGGGHEISSVLASSDWSSGGLGGGHGGLSLGGGHGGGGEYIIHSDFH